MVYYDPRKPKPWPIRLLNKLGVENDSVATNVVVIISIVFLGVAIYLFVDSSTPEVRELSPEQLRMFSQ